MNIFNDYFKNSGEKSLKKKSCWMNLFSVVFVDEFDSESYDASIENRLRDFRLNSWNNHRINLCLISGGINDEIHEGISIRISKESEII